MACLYAHIAHLEQTLLSLSTDIVDLRHELKEKLSADSVYKLQYVGRGNCLVFADNNKPPVMANCDRPDSWKLVRGSQSSGRKPPPPRRRRRISLTNRLIRARAEQGQEQGQAKG